ncbi:MAG TPA: homocysteine S-methyltransferase family protein [Myxococcales bacterium]|nr:homocysteine S-methyltransferase family protein [Myxococcales bacterium]
MLLDAAMGTALLQRGLKGRAPEWNLSHPDEVLAVHRAHVAAGAELVLTNTFVGATADEAAAAVKLARSSGAVKVGGSLWAGLRDLDQQIPRLAGADYLWLESAISLEQALDAVHVALRATKLPVVITCAMRSAPLQQLREAGAALAGYNCTPWPQGAEAADVIKPDAAGLDPQAWAERVAAFSAPMRGGCCGTDARYLAALRATAR